MKNGITMFKNLFDADSVMVPLISLKDHKPQFKEGRVTAPLERSTPEAQGVGSDVILNYLKELKEEKSINMHNILILRNGKIISETAFGNSDLSVWKMTFSACKSVVSLAIGMLVDEGKLDINAPICDFFPEYANPVYKIKLHDITVKTLLTMTTGSSFNEFFCMSTNAWEQAFFKSAFSLKPGSTFNYNSLNTYMLSAIIKKVSGQTLTEYLKPRLFEPLEITNYYFEKSNSDTEKGGWGLYIIPEDFAKIGQLVLNKGLWNAKRIISEEWINEATSIQIATPKQFGKYDYGYHFWSGRQTNSFLFNGMFGQNILGYKDSGILIVTNAGNDELFQQSKFFEITDKYFSGKFQKALPKNNVANRSLLKYSAHLSNGNVKKTFFDYFFPYRKYNLYIKNFELLNKELIASSKNAASVGLLPKLLQIIQNNYSKGLLSVSFYSKGKQLFLKYCETDAQFAIPLGIGEFIRGEIDYHGEKYLISSKIEGNSDIITIYIDFIETFSSRQIIICKQDGAYKLLQKESPGMLLIRESVALFKNSISKNRIIEAAVNKINDDFLIYKCEQIFEPLIELSDKK